MEEHELIELRSEEVQEILGTPPGWLLRWGTTLIVCLVLLLAWLSYLIKYPDIITAPVTIGFSVPTISVVSKTEGTLSKWHVEDSSIVKAGSVLATIQSNASLEDILRLEYCSTVFLQDNSSDCLKKEVKKAHTLDQLRPAFDRIEANLKIDRTATPSRYGQRKGGKWNSNRISVLRKELIKIDAKINALKGEKLPQAEQFAARQRTLYAKGGATRTELEQANARIAEVKIDIASLERDKLIKENEIGKLKAAASKTEPSALGNSSDNQTALSTAVADFLEAIKIWKQNHLIFAPVDGRVSFANKNRTLQHPIKIGDELLLISPIQGQAQQKLSGEIRLPAQGAGKVQAGQRVVIMLDSYPYQEFGTLEARVESKHQTTGENTYSVQLNFTADSLVTNYRKVIPHAPQLSGEAQIITEDKRFIQRIFEKIRGFSSKY